MDSAKIRIAPATQRSGDSPKPVDTIMTEPENTGYAWNPPIPDWQFPPEAQQRMRELGVDPVKLAQLLDATAAAKKKEEEWIAQLARAQNPDDDEPDTFRPFPQDNRVLRRFGLEANGVNALLQELHDYDKARRVPKPKRLRRPVKLDLRDSDGWPESVAGAILLPALIDIIRRHVAIGESLAMLVALWTLHTHALDAFDVSPRLVIRSGQPACGKTRLLHLLSLLVPRPLPICAASPRAILDSLGFHPTLLLDDAAPLLRNQQLCAILRNGRQRSAAHLIRNVGRETDDFDLFAPAALALEGAAPAILRGRCIEFRIDRIKPGESVSALDDKALAELETTRRMAASWAAAQAAQLRVAQAAHAAGEDETWTPLLIIAADAGPEWEIRTREIMQRIKAESGSLLQILLGDIGNLFDQRAAGELTLPAANGKFFADRDRIRSADLARLLGELEARPWSEWGRSAEPLSPHALAKLLAPVGIHSSTLRFHTANQNGPGPASVEKGYLVASFTDAFTRYVTPATFPPPLAGKGGPESAGGDFPPAGDRVAVEGAAAA